MKTTYTNLPVSSIWFAVARSYSAESKKFSVSFRMGGIIFKKRSDVKGMDRFLFLPPSDRALHPEAGFLSAFLKKSADVAWVQVPCILMQEIMDDLVFPTGEAGQEHLVGFEKLAVTRFALVVLSDAFKIRRGIEEYRQLPEVPLEPRAFLGFVEFLFEEIGISLVQMEPGQCLGVGGCSGRSRGGGDGPASASGDEEG
ncbi:MAG: hypothetical protein HY760_00025 [Nitrospirae bacterium]|nr:hypothetical protein [Nitrospirota bacterium]